MDTGEPLLLYDNRVAVVVVAMEAAAAAAAGSGVSGLAGLEDAGTPAVVGEGFSGTLAL